MRPAWYLFSIPLNVSSELFFYLLLPVRWTARNPALANDNFYVD
jgi:hypothetical protein